MSDPSRTDTPASEPETILVVDDQDPGRYVTCRILRGAGYRVTEAATGHEALERAAEAPALMVLNVKLPDISGFEVCRRLRADPATTHLPVLHLSATFYDNESVVTGLEGGADGYLTQPVEPPVLLAYVQALLRMNQALRTVKQSEARFRALFECMSDGLLLADPENRRFYMANNAICDMLGYTHAELTQLWVTDIHPPQDLDRARTRFAEVAAGRVTLMPDLCVLCKDGSIIHVDIGNTLITIDDRTMVLGSFRDISERRSLQRRLAQSDRMASMGLLAAGLAHELNNPLAYVLYNLEALSEDLTAALLPNSTVPEALRDQLLEKANAARDGALRMGAIMKDLRTFSSNEGRDPQPVDLAPLIRSVATMFTNEIRLRAQLELELPTGLITDGVEDRLSRLFLNLLVSAAQTIDEGDPERHLIQVRASTNGDEIRISIHDSGRSLEPEQIARLFDPFHSSTETDTGEGLGLAICHRIVEEHKGRIEVQSTPDEGTCITVVLPSTTQGSQKSEPAPPTTAESLPPAATRLLVVDDEPHLLRAVQRLLTRAGFEVLTATSGTDAQRILAQDTAFDVVLCDLMMPDMMGVDLHRWLLTVDAALASRVLFLTGGTFTPSVRSYLASVDNRVLSKPLPRDELITAIRDQVKRQGDQQQ